VTARYRTGLGSQGNVGADTLTTFVSTVPEVKTITNPFRPPVAPIASRQKKQRSPVPAR
jgi:hypothetical protein